MSAAAAMPGPGPWLWAMALWALLLWPGSSSAMPSPDRVAVLSRGINVTGWFRYPANREPAALRAWLSNEAMDELKQDGFTFVRLAVDPAILDGPAARRVFLDQVRRLEGHGLGVVVSPHPVGWSIDSSPADQERLVAFWRDLAPPMRDLPATMTYPEVLNEPVFSNDPAAWWRLQLRLHAVIRAALPDDTIVLTGHDWSSIDGLLAMIPIADGNVVYTFHFYDPSELTSLAAYRPNLDRAALAQLPFPESSPEECQAVAEATVDRATRDVIRFYCATGWDEDRVRLRIQNAGAWARRHGLALLAGEFGASARLNSAARLAWLRLVRSTCASNGIGWALWGYDDVMGFNVGRPPGNKPELDRSVLKALGLTVF